MHGVTMKKVSTWLTVIYIVLKMYAKTKTRYNDCICVRSDNASTLTPTTHPHFTFIPTGKSCLELCEFWITQGLQKRILRTKHDGTLCLLYLKLVVTKVSGAGHL